MLIEVVNRNAAQRLLEQAKESHGRQRSWGAMHFACSQKQLRPDEERLIFALNHLIGDNEASLYLLDDGDIVITFPSAEKAFVEALGDALYTHFDLSMSEALHCYFDSLAQGEELRSLCRAKLEQAAAPMASGDLAVAPAPTTFQSPSVRQSSDFRHALKRRATGRPLEILIVEDQPFSAKLLAGLLDRIARTFIAPDSAKAMELYLDQAPDIAFLDVELPGMNGHDLAAAFRRIDSGAYIVMVTADHHVEDVRRAKANGARGFVAKPYSKQKILENVEKYINERQLGQ